MSEPTLTVPVELGHHSYTIQIGTGNLPQLSTLIDGGSNPEHVVIISDDHVLPLYGNAVGRALEQADTRVDILHVAAGESSKSIANVEQLWNQLLECGTDRSTVVVAVGGGVVGDLAGFIAASYARGIRFVQVPTTLLAQVDSSVGGKVGINLAGAKNMVGAFWQPALVVIDTDTLSTLPDRQLSAGLAEVVKYGVIMDKPFFEELEAHADSIWQRDPSALRRIVARCCELKAEVVAEDERETTGRRAILNYGHTFCHAIEALAGYGSILHGEAVAMGMMCATRLAESLGRIGPDVGQRQARLLERFQLSLDLPELDTDQMIDVMRRDKKSQRGNLRFVLPTKLGHVELVDGVDSDLVRQAIVGG